MKIKSFRGKTAMLSTEIMEKNEQLGNVRPRQETVPCPMSPILRQVRVGTSLPDGPKFSGPPPLWGCGRKIYR